MNLGLYQADGVISDLAPARPVDPPVLARPRRSRTSRQPGRASSSDGVPETAFLTVTFAGGATANVQISWLAPRKMRQMVVVGSQADGAVRGHLHR